GDAALGRCQGKQTGETALFHTLHDHLEAGDLLLADRCYNSSWELALVRQRGADLVTRLHQGRRADFRRGRRLGPADHVVTWEKPPRPPPLGPATYAALPKRMQVRELRGRVRHPGFRTRVLVAGTALLGRAGFPRPGPAGV